VYDYVSACQVSSITVYWINVNVGSLPDLYVEVVWLTARESTICSFNPEGVEALAVDGRGALEQRLIVGDG